MKLQNVKRIVVEDFAEAERALAEKIGGSVNTFSEEVYRTLSNNVSVEDNLNMQYKDLRMKVDTLGVPTSTIAFKSSLNGRCKGITVEKVESLDGPTTGSITGNTNANPTVITSATHGLSSGYEVLISGSNSTPSINGIWKIVVLTASTFTIPVSCSVAGTAGSFSTGSYLFHAPFMEWTENGGLITISHCTGLKADKEYTVRILAKA